MADKDRLRTLTKFRIVAITDGTASSAEILATYTDGTWGQLGYGTAKRRKGDVREEGMGMTLALKRAFEDAAERCGKELEANGF